MTRSAVSTAVVTRDRADTAASVAMAAAEPPTCEPATIASATGLSSRAAAVAKVAVVMKLAVAAAVRSGESAGVIATAVLLAKVAAQATAAGKITAGRVVLLVRAMSPDNQVLPEPLEMAGAVVVPAAPTAAQLATADMQTAVLAPEVAEGITVVVAVAAVRANTRAYMGARAARAAADHLGPSPALRTSALGEAGKMQRVTD